MDEQPPVPTGELGVGKGFRSGYATIAGRPNVGKSTLLNRVLGEKIAITSPKPQTTRDPIVGIKHVPGAQIVFLDTPGIHDPKGSRLNKVMVARALAAVQGVDVVLFLVDAAKQAGRDPGSISEGDRRIAEVLKQQPAPVLLLLNKVDGVSKPLLLPAIDAWQKVHDFAEIFPISARTGLGVDDVVSAVVDRLPEGPAYFPDDMVTDRSQRFLMAEVIREKLFLQLGQELPYAMAVEIEAWEERPEIVHIQAAIHVAKDSQKKIVIGARGSRIKEVGTAARQDMEAFLERRVFLELYVRVEEDWTERPQALRRFGYLDQGEAVPQPRELGSPRPPRSGDEE